MLSVVQKHFEAVSGKILDFVRVLIFSLGEGYHGKLFYLSAFYTITFFRFAQEVLRGQVNGMYYNDNQLLLRFAVAEV